ncbi:ML domain protein, partial [Opisthorchis viverrini]
MSLYKLKGLWLKLDTMHLPVIVLFSAAFYVPCLPYSISYTDCGSVDITVISVSIEPCDREPCTLIRGTTVSVVIRFMALERIYAGGSTIQGVFPAGPIRVPLQVNGVCAQLVPPCPIEVGEVYTYEVTDRVPDTLPPGLLTIRWELLNDNGTPFLCIEFPVVVAVAA